MATGLIGLVEAEFRQLSQDARKGEGITSWLSSSDYPEVKEAAERAVLKVRSFADSPDALEQIRHSKEILKPLLLACDTKSNKLVSHALSTAQKLLANGALSQEGAVAVGGMLVKVEKSSDETVQLKILQTALTLLQSPWHPTGMDDIGAVLGVCFRMLSSKGHKDTVVSTATATVRQAVALVFSYVDVDGELARIDRVVARQQQGSPPNAQQLQPGQDAQAEQQQSSPAGTQATALSAESSSSVAEVPAVEQSSSSSAAGSGEAQGSVQAEMPATAVPGLNGAGPAEPTIGGSKEAGVAVADELAAPTVQAAHKLLEDLCAIATGAPPQWLKTPSLPRTFVLEILDFVLTNSAAIFRSLPAFENTLSVWISQILMSQLQDHLDAGAAGSAMAVNSFSTFRAVLRTSRTVLRGFYPQIGMRCGSMVQGLLRGLSPKIPLFQRIAVMQVLKQLMGDACFVYFLFSAYDMQPELHFEIVQATVQSCTDIVEGTVKAANNKDPEDDPPLELVMGMCHARAQGKDWTMDTDFEVAQVPVQSAYLSLLALDTLMAFMGSVEKLTDFLVLEGGHVPESARRFPIGGVETVELDTCRAMVGRNWRKMLSVFRELLLQCNGEDMIVMLLKGYQVFTQACGQLEMLEPRDAFLGTLCEFALSSSAALGNGGSPSAVSGRLASPRGADPDSGLVLSPKNVQSMRALFNIAHRLSNVLGPAWTLVLETMYTLDTILHSPHTTTQEVSNTSGEQPMCSDVAILSAAASQMFECTSSMSREAVVSLLSGLRDVSVRHIPQAVQVQQPKLFALNRMVEVLLYNKSRIYDLWAIFLSHVLELASDSKIPVRAAAIEALDRAIVGTLGSPRHAVRRTGDGTGSPRDDSGGVEYMLLVAMESLYSGNTERDVQLGVLRVLLNVLQRHGEHLSDGWTPVFRLLASVPSQKDAERTDLAFQSVQLTCSDYMAAMPYARMKRSLEVAAMYGSQQVDLNVSLTAISLLWNAADMLGRQGAGSSSNSLRQLGPRLGMNSEDEGGQDDTVVSNGPAAVEVTEPRAAPDVLLGEKGSKPPAPQFSAAETEELLQLIFVALQCLAMDLRPEVRNSGVRTLFAVIVNQGPRLSLELWERCLWEMMFPLLRHAYRMSANSDKEEAEAQLLGSTRGKEVRLMVHHSRNSEQKQWDETVVIALGGMGRLLKAHLPAVVQLEAFPAAWEELMVVVESSMAGGRKEVALAAIMLLGGVLQAHAGPPLPQHDSAAGGASNYGVDVVSDVMWKRAMRALDVGVEAATSPTCQVPLQARIELVNLLGSSFSMLKNRFDDEDTRQVYFWLERFCKNPWSDDDAANTVQVAMGLPPVQKAVLALLPSLGPAHLPQLWPELIFTLVRFLKPNQVLDNWRRQRAEQQQRAAVAAALAAQQQQQEQEAAALQSAQQGLQQQQSQAKLQKHGVPAGTASLPGSTSQLGSGAAGKQQAVQAPGSVQEATEAALPARPPQQQPLMTPKHALSSVFLEKVLEALVSMYQGVAPPLEAKAVTFPAVVTALGRCMEVRYVAFSEPLWRQAAQAFIAIVPAGLPAVAAAYAEAAAQPGPDAWGSSPGNGLMPQNPAAVGQAAPEGAWEALAAAFEGFLLGADNFGQSEQQTGQPVDQAGQAQGSANGSLTMGGLSEDPGMLLASRRQPSQHHQQIHRQASSAAQEGGTVANGGLAAVTSEPPLDPAQCRADAELEVAVLDTLADVVLTAAGSASRAMKLRLVQAVDGGISRPTEINIRQVSTGANFSHVCLRKLYVLCSRGGASLGAASAFLPDDQVAACLLEVAQLALPVLLARCESMLRAFWEGSLLRSASASPMPSPGNPSSATDLQQLQQLRDRAVHSGRNAGAGPPGGPRLDEVMCVLEVLASMSLAQQVVDAALAGNDHMRQLVAMLRSRPEVSARGRERTHLLLLYPLLCEGITCKEARVREMVKDVLQLAGAELGLGSAGLGGSGAVAVGGVVAAGAAAGGAAVEEAVVMAGETPETAVANGVEL